MDKRPVLNLPPANIRIRNTKEREEVWDDIRKQWLALTPEEWVRQNFIAFLTGSRGVDPLHIRQEQVLRYNDMNLRADIVVYGAGMDPLMIVECKAPHVRITRAVLEQVCKYNQALRLPYVCVTNGMSHFCFGYDSNENVTQKLDTFPCFGK